MIPNVKLPTVRDLFIPDPGHIIFDVDLSGADAQVVAWEAEDADLKRAFRSGLKVHSHNAVTIDPSMGPYEEFNRLRNIDPRYADFYKAVKIAVHATNYGATARTLCQSLGWTTKRTTAFQRTWFGLHPAILGWHKRIERGLQKDRRVYNKFGYHRIYFDRLDTVFAQAVAWGPQSTVGLVCARGDRALTNYFRKNGNGAILIQVHDSLVGQTRARGAGRVFRDIHEILHSISIPYDPDPLIIPWGIKTSPKSWGHCKEVKWKELM